MQADPPSILILTASFGEGHNAAARGMAAAFRQAGEHRIRVETADVLTEIHPAVQKLLLRSYNFTTTKAPNLWYRFYQVTDRLEPTRVGLEILRTVKRNLRKRIEEIRPTAVICTYPTYNLLIEQIFRGEKIPFPIYTVITDSVNIHSMWLKGPSSAWFVTDGWTRGILENEGIDPALVLPMGFPIHPSFGQRGETETMPDLADGPRILYFATTRRRHVRETLRGLAEWNQPNKHITVLLGKHEDRLRPVVEEVFPQFRPGQLQTLGWTDRVPELMHTHHLILSKPGGATVHEAMAANAPMCINGAIPGQEEGNATLLQRAHSGVMIQRPEQLPIQLDFMFGDNAELWRELHANTSRIGRPDAALRIADFVLENSGVIAQEKG